MWGTGFRNLFHSLKFFFWNRHILIPTSMNHSNEIWNSLYVLLIFLLFRRVSVQENMFVEIGINALPLRSIPLLSLAPMPSIPSLFLLKVCVFRGCAWFPSVGLLLTVIVSWMQTAVKTELTELTSCLYSLWSGLRTCRPSSFVFSLHLFHPAAAKGFYFVFRKINSELTSNAGRPLQGQMQILKQLLFGRSSLGKWI